MGYRGGGRTISPARRDVLYLGSYFFSWCAHPDAYTAQGWREKSARPAVRYPSNQATTNHFNHQVDDKVSGSRRTIRTKLPRYQAKYAQIFRACLSLSLPLPPFLSLSFPISPRPTPSKTPFAKERPPHSTGYVQQPFPQTSAGRTRTTSELVILHAPMLPAVARASVGLGGGGGKGGGGPRARSRTGR